jgi:hypothetical protein
MTTSLEGGEGLALRPGRCLPPEKNGYPLYRRLCGPQGWSGQVRKTSFPSRFDPRTVQPVASRCTDYATLPTPLTALIAKYQHSHILAVANIQSLQTCVIMEDEFQLESTRGRKEYKCRRLYVVSAESSPSQIL